MDWGEEDYDGLGHFAGLPRPRYERRRVLRVHVGTFSFQEKNENVVSFLVGNRENRYRLWPKGLQEGSIVLVVKSEEKKNEALGWVRAAGVKWRSLFAVQLEE